MLITQQLQYTKKKINKWHQQKWQQTVSCQKANWCFSNHCQTISQLLKCWGNSLMIWQALLRTFWFLDWALIYRFTHMFDTRSTIEWVRGAYERIMANELSGTMAQIVNESAPPINQFGEITIYLLVTVLEFTRKNCTSFSVCVLTNATWLMRHKSQLKKQINTQSSRNEKYTHTKNYSQSEQSPPHNKYTRRKHSNRIEDGAAAALTKNVYWDHKSAAQCRINAHFSNQKSCADKSPS